MIAAERDAGIAKIRRQLAAVVLRELRREPAVDLIGCEECLPAADLFRVAVKSGGPAFELETAALQHIGFDIERLCVKRPYSRRCVVGAADQRQQQRGDDHGADCRDAKLAGHEELFRTGGAVCPQSATDM